MCEKIKTKLNAVYFQELFTIYDNRQILVQRIQRWSFVCFWWGAPRPPSRCGYWGNRWKSPRHDSRWSPNESAVAEAVGVSYGTAFNILHDNLRMKKLPARWVPRSQCTGSLLRSRHRQIDRIALQIAAASTVLSGSSSLWLLLVSKLKKMARWKEIHVEWEGHRRKKPIFQSLTNRIFLRG